MGIPWKQLLRKESGQILPIVLVTLAVGSIIVAPSLNYVATNLVTQAAMKQNVQGAYAAEAGIEDAMWRLVNGVITSDDLRNGEYGPYTLGGTINGMTVDVTVIVPGYTPGEDGGYSGDPEGPHDDSLLVDKEITYDPLLDGGNGGYICTIYMKNNGEGNIKLTAIGVDLSQNLEYIPFSTSGNLTSQEPVSSGNVTTGIMLEWIAEGGQVFPPPPETWSVGQTRVLQFHLSGPEGLNVQTFISAVTKREDISAFDLYPYIITATATDGAGNVQTRITAAVWQKQSNIAVRNWQIFP